MSQPSSFIGAAESVLEQLAVRGWSISIGPGLDDSFAVRATRGELVLTREGASIAEASLLVHREAVRVGAA